MSFRQPTESENDFSISENLNSEIDIENFLTIIFRRKYLIIIASTLSLLFGAGYSLSKRSIWEGHSQIVMRENNPINIGSGIRSSENKNPLTSFSKLTYNNFYVTELKILESPYILKPIYDFVKESKEISGIDTSGMTFRKWKKQNFSVKQADNSAVLNLVYRDTDKSLILPVIKKISLAYQQYSGSDRERGLSQGINFLERQIIKAVNDTRESLIALQDFSLENGLGNLDGLPLIKDTITDFGSVEKDLSDNTENINSNRFEIQYLKLSNLEEEYVLKSAFLKPNSSTLMQLKIRIDQLKESLSRPKEVLLKYRELKQSASLNESKLLRLRSQLSILKLEEARQSNPWQLISQPTLLDDPSGPNRLRITFLSLIIGFIGSILYVLRMDKISGRIYNFKELQQKITYPFLIKLPLNKKEKWSNYIEIILKGTINKDECPKINLIPVGSLIDYEKLDLLSTIFSGFSTVDKVFISSNIIESFEDRKNFLIIESGMCTYNELTILIQKLKILKYPMVGWIYIDPDS